MTKSEIRLKIYEEVKNKQMKGKLTLKTSCGDIVFQLHSNLVPIPCENFLELSEKGYYNDTKFHRLVPHFMVLFIFFLNFNFKYFF